jgi:hypothetical protein
MGGTLYIRAGGAFVPHHVGGLLADDPGVFLPLTGDAEANHATWPSEHDLVLAIGADEPAGSEWWNDPQRLRAAGFGVAWVVNGTNTADHDLQPGELVIDTWTPFDDAVVSVEHYDAKLGPVSSVVAEAITWAIQAEVTARVRP